MTTTDRSTVLSVFENETQAHLAMDELQRMGISSNRISYYVRKSGTDITDSLERLGLPEQEASFYNEEFEADHPVVMVNAGERQQDVPDLLYRNGGYDMKTRDAHIRDFGSLATSGTKGEQRLKLREELLRVQKQPGETVSGTGGRVRQTEQATYQLVPFPQAQHEIAVALRLTEHKHSIHVLTEVDVTTPRQVIQEQKVRGREPLSFTAFITACLGKAVDEDKTVHAHRKGRNQLVLFDDVDVFLPVEHEVEGQQIPLEYVVRAANRKTAQEIHQEIRAFQNLPTPEVTEMPPWLSRVLVHWPGVSMKLTEWVLSRSPLLWKRMVGTCGITALGMFGKGMGWGLPTASIYTLFLTLGSITAKPGIVDGQIAIREYLHLTVDFDHDIIDGAHAARFVTRLKELIESGFGLLDQEGIAEQTRT